MIKYICVLNKMLRNRTLTQIWMWKSKNKYEGEYNEMKGVHQRTQLKGKVSNKSLARIQLQNINSVMMCWSIESDSYKYVSSIILETQKKMHS